MSELRYYDTRWPVDRAKYRSIPAHNVLPDRLTHGVQRLIAELNRDMAHLDENIAAEEAATGITELSNFSYSLAARNMRARRDNLASTKAALLARLEVCA